MLDVLRLKVIFCSYILCVCVGGGGGGEGGLDNVLFV